jgi:hypothetical protein
MKPAKFETYKPKQGEFAVAQPRTGVPLRPYTPTPHPFVERLLEHRNIPSMWTPGTIGSGK